MVGVRDVLSVRKAWRIGRGEDRGTLHHPVALSVRTEELYFIFTRGFAGTRYPVVS